ncbi:MAG TPA: AMP-binding protein [Streptosporangiaceae bacterium]|nr:AMP-binding protein [Streptosporangiaceae bacterium]
MIDRPGQCLPDLLRHQAETRPRDVAVRWREEQLSFAGLRDRSAGVARLLWSLGARPDTVVGLFAEPSADLVANVWGIVCAGAAYLPLAPDYPDDRLRFMLADSRTPIVLTEKSLVARLASLAPQVTVVPGVGGPPGPTALAAHSAPISLGLRPENLAYLVYTSGSSGRPKGTMIEHRGIVSQLAWLRDYGGVSHHETVLFKTPLSFDAAQWEALASACGATVMVAPPGTYRDPRQLIDTVVRHDVTTLQCVPSLLRALLDSEELGRCSSLRRLFSGGEALASGLASRVAETLPWCQLVNLYGPTECTINSSAFFVQAAERSPREATVVA